MVVALMIVVQSVPRFICSIRIGIFVLPTTIMMANTAGSLPFDFRLGIGKRSLVQPIILVVQSVTIFRVCVLFKDKHNVDEYCWFSTDSVPFVDWVEVCGRGDNDCCLMCSSVSFDSKIRIQLK